MGQRESAEKPSARKAVASTDANSVGKIAARRATEAERRKAERDLQKQLKEDEKRVAAALAASQRAERDAKLSSRSKPHQNPRHVEAEGAQPPPVPAPAPRAVKQPATSTAAQPKQKATKCVKQHNNDNDEGVLPPEVAAMMVDVNDETAGMSADVEALTAAALAAAEATLLCDDDDDPTTMGDGDDDDDLNTCVAQQQQQRKRQPTTSSAKHHRAGVDREDSVSLHSSDFRDEALMEQLADIEGEVEAERQVRVEELDAQIAAMKKNAVALMKGGDKPAALEELKRAKHLEKEREALVA